MAEAATGSAAVDPDLGSEGAAISKKQHPQLIGCIGVKLKVSSPASVQLGSASLVSDCLMGCLVELQVLCLLLLYFPITNISAYSIHVERQQRRRIDSSSGGGLSFLCGANLPGTGRRQGAASAGKVPKLLYSLV